MSVIFSFTVPSKPQRINLYTSQRKMMIICFKGGKKLKLAVKSLAQGHRGGAGFVPSRHLGRRSCKSNGPHAGSQVGPLLLSATALRVIEWSFDI